ncbi:uncharacterized protein PV07_08650 [Cladophialophora immunda]|uniref:DNA2/NAM7 helicase helicase domain-containing protein n=1 Tax=Cladophialophora immunda TaxID=569365 RepID=A0A0D2CPL5_9EURO|nr:uncharacterized protein PV07_08650 [Cladophialophora immunda]KIW25484.1 hypothetical protein PV07_08650 [Cladophialophora immunda]
MAMDEARFGAYIIYIYIPGTHEGHLLGLTSYPTDNATVVTPSTELRMTFCQDKKAEGNAELEKENGEHTNDDSSEAEQEEAEGHEESQQIIETATTTPGVPEPAATLQSASPESDQALSAEASSDSTAPAQPISEHTQTSADHPTIQPIPVQTLGLSFQASVTRSPTPSSGGILLLEGAPGVGKSHFDCQFLKPFLTVDKPGPILLTASSNRAVEVLLKNAWTADKQLVDQGKTKSGKCFLCLHSTTFEKSIRSRHIRTAMEKDPNARPDIEERPRHNHPPTV